MAHAEITDLIERFKKVYHRFYGDEIEDFAKQYPNEAQSLYLDWQDISRQDTDLAEKYLNQPVQMRGHAEEALRLFELSVNADLENAHVRIHNLPNTTGIADIRSHHINTLVSIQGTVERASDVESDLQLGAFECQRCGTLTYWPQENYEDTKEPEECQGCEREGSFEVDSDHSEYADSQTILVKRRPRNATTESEASIEVELEDDITGVVTPGDIVTVAGVVNVLENNRTDASVADKTHQAHSITIEDDEYLDLDITNEDKKKIVKLSQQSNLYEQMAGSIAPSTYGYDREKLAIILQLFSGVTKHLPDETRVRGDIHIALFGDPGPFESRLLDYAGRLAPRTISVSGTGSSAVGLTASMKKTSRTSTGSKTWAVEAGALPLADRGLACINNLDMFGGDQRASLIDVLEDQTFEVNKATISARLRARASVLASAQPKYGRFDQYEPIGEQLDLEPELISQFDLIFTVTDQPDEHEDRRRAEHTLQASYSGELNAQQQSMSAPNISPEEVEKQAEAVAPAIDPDLLRKYIAYAKRNCFPTLTDEAMETIRDFYVDLRTKGADEDAPVPVTARKLEALVRLAEASAKVRLSDTVEVSDAERAIETVRSCLQDIGVDPEAGQFDADVVERAREKNQRDRIKNVKQLIADIEEEYDDGAPEDVVIDRSDEIGLGRSKVEHEILKLKDKGEVYEPAKNHLRTT